MMLQAIAIVMALAGATAAHAQGRGTVYLAGGAALMHQDGPSGESPETYVTAPGGTTVGWFAGGGVFVANWLAIDVELSRTGWMTSRQPSRHGMTFNEERRDQFISFATRFAFPAAGIVRIEPVAGIVLTRPEAWGQTERNMVAPSPQPVSVDPRQQRLLDRGVGVAVGADLRIGGRHIALCPTFRLIQSGVSGGQYDEHSAPNDISSIYPGGYPEWTVRGGLALRVDF
jgi:hypothetical protein